MTHSVRIFSLLSLLLVSFFFVACSKDDSEERSAEQWREANNSYFRGLYTKANAEIAMKNTKWKVIKSVYKSDGDAVSAENSIVVEVLNEGTGSGCPEGTDSIRVHYRGTLYDGTMFDTSWMGEYNLKTMTPSSFKANALCHGFTTAVQYMHIGDRWRVHMPHNLGYGTNGNGSIRGYSTLTFDITLEAYSRPGTAMPPVK